MPGETLLTYPAASSAPAGAVRLATTAGERPAPSFDGFAQHPVPAARALLVVSAVAGARFHTPAVTLAERPRAADLVVTAEPGRLRFESFSQCAGAHVRLDLLDDGLDVRELAPGAAAIDFNEPVRAALSKLTARDPLHLVLGADAGAVRTPGGGAVRRRVASTRRWVGGYGEAQAALVGARQVLELDRARAQRFLYGLPGGRLESATGWVLPASGGVGIGQRRRRGAVCLAGTARLRALLALARFATGLRAYADPASTGPTPVAWVLDIPGGRLTLTLSPEPGRAFAGDESLLDVSARDDAALLARALASRTRFGHSDATAAAGAGATSALRWLCLHGRLGYDAADAACFWRRLPYAGDSPAAAGTPQRAAA